MTLEKPTYLELFDAAGAWIERPDLMVLAALSKPKKIDIKHAYHSMLLEERENPSLTMQDASDSAIGLEKKVIRGDLTNRLLAGSTLGEFARLMAFPDVKPSLNAARKLVAYNQFKNTRKSSPESIRREVEKAVRKYKPTLHFQAAFLFEKDIETDEKGLRRFLGLARSFERLVDSNLVPASFCWIPLRVPSEIKALAIPPLEALSKDELSFLN